MTKLTFFSNYLNAHVLPLCQAFCNIKDVEFTFVALSHGGNAGRTDLNDSYPFVLREYECDQLKADALLHAIEDDIVIFGDMCGKEQYVEARLERNLLSFRATERLLKRGLWWRFVLPKVIRTRLQFTQYKDKPLYVLCASAYASYDLSLFGWPDEKCFKWSYFPKVDPVRRSNKSHDGVASIVWAGRLIQWKRPLEPLQLASKLKQDHKAFHLTMAGDGPLMDKCKSFVREHCLSDVVTLAGMLSGEETKKLMCSANIYITTSSRKEGWGATVNEAMEAGCAVVASASIGSAPFLIEDGVNGLLYDDLDASGLDLVEKIEYLIDNSDFAAALGINAGRSMSREWGPAVAAGRIIELAESLRDQGDDLSFASGPCSRATIISDGWYHNGRQTV
ncbi:MAG: glycosyltransferase family 4 protein [Olegusella sp.]|nr:glycosyltransferase family 4 protein [Olegusella sp.]